MSIVTITTSCSLRRQVSYWFVLNLAVIDALISLIVVPLNTVWEYYGIWPFGKQACKFITFADSSFSTVSAYSVVLVSIDKYMYITHAIQYHNRMTRRLAFILILGVWISVCIFSSVSIFAGLSSSHFEENITNTCIFAMKDAHVVPTTIVSFFIPLLILCFTSSRIICIARRHIKRIHATPSFSCTEIVLDESTCVRTTTVKADYGDKSKRKSISIVSPCSLTRESAVPVYNSITASKLSTTCTTISGRPKLIFGKSQLPPLQDMAQHHERLKTISSCPTLHQTVSLPRLKRNIATANCLEQ